MTVQDAYDHHHGYVRSVIYRMVGNSDDVDDLAQEVFLHLVRKIDSFNGQSQFRTWLHTITVNVVLESIRRKRVRGGSLVTSLDAMEDEAREQEGGTYDRLQQALTTRDRWLESVVELDELYSAIAKLSPRLRASVVLRLEGHEHEEVATILGIKPSGARTRHMNAKRALRKRLLPQKRKGSPKAPLSPL